MLHLKSYWLRILLGLFIAFILIGEAVVGGLNPVVFLIHLPFYLTYFILMDLLIARYKLNYKHVFWLSLALYAIIATSFFNREIIEYANAKDAGDIIVTSLIRLHGASFAVATFYLTNRIMPRKPELGYYKSGAWLWIMLASFLLVLMLMLAADLTGFLAALAAVPLLTLAMMLIAAIIALYLYKSKKEQPQPKPVPRWINIVIAISFFLGFVFLLGPLLLLLLALLLTAAVAYCMLRKIPLEV